MHMWKVSPGVFLMSGLGNMGAMDLSVISIVCNMLYHFFANAHE